MALPQGALAKLVSIINEREKGGGDKNPPKKEEPKSYIDPADPEARQKSAAIIGSFKPVLNEALRAKDPEMFDAWENKRKELLASAVQYAKQGDIKKYQEAQKLVDEYQDKTPMELYLSKDEIRKVLGDQYEPFQEAMKINNQFYAKRNVVGGKEMPAVAQMEDVAYGKRMMTQPSLTSAGGEYYQFYNPATKTFEKRSYKELQAGRYK